MFSIVLYQFVYSGVFTYFSIQKIQIYDLLWWTVCLILTNLRLKSVSINVFLTRWDIFFLAKISGYIGNKSTDDNQPI